MISPSQRMRVLSWKPITAEDPVGATVRNEGLTHHQALWWSCSTAGFYASQPMQAQYHGISPVLWVGFYLGVDHTQPFIWGHRVESWHSKVPKTKTLFTENGL